MENKIEVRWTSKTIEKEINEVRNALGIKRMPTMAEVNRVMQNTSLSNAISKSGGFYLWAEKLKLSVKISESDYSRDFEIKCKDYIESKGFSAELTPTRFPYDILVDGVVKVEVKASRLYKGRKGNFYSFNLDKKLPKSDINIFYCDNELSERIYVIPSYKLKGINQLSIGEVSSKYDRFINRWDYLAELVLLFNILKHRIDCE